MNLKNRTKALLRADRPALGIFVFFNDPGVVDTAGLAGFDFVVIDCEHAGKSTQTIENMVRAAEAAAITSIVRVSEVEEKVILQVLETGAQGIMLPFIRTPEMAERGRFAVRFPPDGSRGTCRVSRAAKYGSYMSTMSEYMKRANEETLLVGTVEDMDAVRGIDGILDLGRFDVCVIGRGDLSTNLGVPGQVEHPSVARAVTRVAAAAKTRSCSLGIGSYSLDESRRFIKRGFNFIVYSADTSLLHSSMKNGVDELRSVYRRQSGDANRSNRRGVWKGASKRD